MKNNKFEVIQDPENENIYYTATQDEYDDANERTIIGFGKTEKEALEDALENALTAASNCQKVLKNIHELVEWDTTSGRFYPEERKVPIEADFETHTSKSFSALVWIDKEKTWCRYYR